MQAYFFNRGIEQNILYIPKNLIVLEDNFNYNIDYSVKNIRAFDEIWKRDKRLILGNFKDSLIDVIDIPEDIVKTFIGFCFSEKMEDALRAHFFSVQIFESAKQEVNDFRKRNLK